MLKFNNHVETIQRIWDVVKKTAYGVDFVIWGLENQCKIHYAMPLRTMLGDALSYLKKYNEIAARNKHEKDFSSSDEFLSGLKKTDRLHPVISLCVYYGEDEWDGPLSLTDMLCIPEHLTPLVSDYKMNLIQIRNSDSLIFHNNEVHTVFDLSRLIYNKEFDKIQSTYMNQKFDTELSLVIGTITNTKSFINHALQSDSEGGSINMCRAFEKWQEECIQKGVQQGIQTGITQGEIIGTLKTYKKCSFSKEETLKNIITDFSLSEEDARNYMEKYW